MDKEKQKQEALTRLSMLNVMGDVRRAFRNNQRLYYSERQSRIFNATLYYLDEDDKFVQIVKDFEEKTGGMVYHAQLTHTEFGDLFSLLYVSKDEDEWEQDKEDIRNGEAFVNVINLDLDESEFGYIGVEGSMGGVTRTF